MNTAVIQRKQRYSLIIQIVDCQYSTRCDHTYMNYLRDTFRQYLGENVVLFTVGMNSLLLSIDRFFVHARYVM
jgi:hypothetical protein